MVNITNTNVTLMSSSLEKSIAFYTDILGFELKQRYGNHYAQIAAPGILIGLHPGTNKFSASENISIGFTVNNYEEAKKELDACSIDYKERKDQGGKFIHFNDPDGHQLYFIQPKN